MSIQPYTIWFNCGSKKIGAGQNAKLKTSAVHKHLNDFTAATSTSFIRSVALKQLVLTQPESI